MQGEFRGDFTRDIDDDGMHLQRVLMQQGRVILDADWNQAFAIIHEHLALLARDIFGPHGGPHGECGFQIIATEQQAQQAGLSAPLTAELRNGFIIGPGRYYVQGMLCRNNTFVSTATQPFPYVSAQLEPGKYLIYLDAWERMFPIVEDRKPGLREVALNGELPAQRTQIAWQVRPLELRNETDPGGAVGDKFAEVLKREQKLQTSPNGRETMIELQKLKRDLNDRAEQLLQAHAPETSRVRLKAKAGALQHGGAPCITPPDARYRGDANLLVRVELFHSGDKASATFVWDVNNSADEYPIIGGTGDLLQMEHLGHDSVHRLAPGDVVELVDVQRPPRQSERTLFTIATVNPVTREVQLKRIDAAATPPQAHAGQVLRRWQTAAIKVADAQNQWYELRDGIQIQFAPEKDSQGADRELRFCSGDYWLIPVRTATGDVEWPREPAGSGEPAALPPHGVAHWSAPLAIVEVTPQDRKTVDCRYIINHVRHPQILPVTAQP